MWVKCKQGLSVVLSIEGNRRITAGVEGDGSGETFGVLWVGGERQLRTGVGPPQEAHGLSLSSKPSCGSFLDLKKNCQALRLTHLFLEYVQHFTLQHF